MKLFKKAFWYLREYGIKYVAIKFLQILGYPFNKLISTDYYEELSNKISQNKTRFASNKISALSLLLWNLISIFRLDASKNLIRKKKINNDGSVNISFVVTGGIGDYILFANWFWYFSEKFLNLDVKVYINSTSKLTKAIVHSVENKVYISDNTEISSDVNYDLLIEFNRYPQIIRANKNKIKSVSKELLDYVELCEKHYAENEYLYGLGANHQADGISCATCISQGKKRIQQPDIYSYFGITEDYTYDIKINEDEDKFLADVGLKDKNYILVHRGWGMGDKFNVKAWSLKSCPDLIKKIKDAFPSYIIVAFGSETTQAPNADYADIDLIEKTSFEQVKVLLKHASVLVDNEGGMVHLRYALHGGPSVVLFGPTSVDFYGYSSNINIKSNVCKHWCEWLDPKLWPVKCPAGFEGVPCMEGITTEMVIHELKNL